MKKNSFYSALVLLCAVVQGAWAQTPAHSTELEPFVTTLNNRMVYKFNYPSTSVTGEPVVLSALLCCWAPATPQENAAIESVHLYNHYTVTANSQCPSNSTGTIDFTILTIMFEGTNFDDERTAFNIVKRSIVIMPDYEGYGVSSDRTHPYLAEAVTAQQSVDAMTYGLELYDKLNGAYNSLPLKEDWRCFSVGYSQGGAVALAVQRYIEQNNLSDKLHFRGTLCGDGPYDLLATMRYYLDDNGTSYGVTTDHRKNQVTLPAVLPMIMNGMIVSNPAMSSHKLSDYFEQSFLDTGIMDWLNSKNQTTDNINTAWLHQIDKGTATVGGKTYPAPANMSEMFIKQQVPGMIWGTTDVAWAKLDKIFTTGFYNYMKDPANFTNAPALTGNAYEDMHYALESNNVCTGWQPQHRIQFAHSKGDMVVPYGNYLAFRDAHPDDENILYRIDDTFSTSDHVSAGTTFVMSMGSQSSFFDYFLWIDGEDPTGIKTTADVRSMMSDAWYDLAGQKLDGKPTKKGIYIHQGRKVIISR